MTDRFDVTGNQDTMKAVVTTGNGGYDKLEYREVPVPRIGPGEALLQVLAAGINNTEINTRLGWYSSAVTSATNDAAGAQETDATHRADGGWNEATPFPFIQGTDCCGRVVKVAKDVDRTLLGQRHFHRLPHVFQKVRVAQQPRPLLGSLVFPGEKCFFERFKTNGFLRFGDAFQLPYYQKISIFVNIISLLNEC